MILEGKSILLTGGGSGIGRMTALAFAARNARLTLLGRRDSPLQETAALVRQAGGEAVVVVGDVSNEATRKAVIETAVSHYGGIDVLINNAGNVRAGRLEDISTGDIAAMIEVNLIAPILLTQAALPTLRKNGDAAIVNISSGIALIGAPFYTVYAAAKAGIARFGEALRRELAGEGVRVITIYPTATDTPMMASSKAGPELGFNRESSQDVAESIIAGIENNALEVIRGGDTLAKMIELNRTDPLALDYRFAELKSRLEDAVRGHRAI